MLQLLLWLPILFSILDSYLTWWIVEIKGGKEVWKTSKWVFKPKKRRNRLFRLVIWTIFPILCYLGGLFLVISSFKSWTWLFVIISILLTLSPVIYNSRSINDLLTPDTRKPNKLHTVTHLN